MPKVSIILTSYNHEKYLRQAIDSVLSQTFADFELIIWDDASTDGSWEIIRAYDDSRIKAYRNDRQRRGVYGINKAISEVAQGEFIAIHHSDDVWSFNKLEQQVDLLERASGVGAVFTGVKVIDEDGLAVNDDAVYYNSVFDVRNKDRFQWLRQFFTVGNALCHPSALVRKACYDRCGAYRYGLAQVGDFDMWIRLCLQYEIFVIDEDLVKFRYHRDGGNTSGVRPDGRRRIPYEFFQILDSFAKINSVSDVLKIFPEAQAYMVCEVGDPVYLVARVAIDLKPFPFSPLWGQMLLFSMLNDSVSAHRLQVLHNFSVANFIELTGRNDIFSFSR